MTRRMNLSYRVARDIEHFFVINAGFQQFPETSDFVTLSSGAIETKKTPRQVLNRINRDVCQELFGNFRGYGYYLIGHSPLQTWSIESREKEKSLGHLLYIPETTASTDSDKIEEVLRWNLAVNETSYRAYQSLICRFVV